MMKSAYLASRSNGLASVRLRVPAADNLEDDERDEAELDCSVGGCVNAAAGAEVGDNDRVGAEPAQIGGQRDAKSALAGRLRPRSSTGAGRGRRPARPSVRPPTKGERAAGLPEERA